MSEIDAQKITQHQWTHDGDRVLLVKCVGKEGRSYDGFQWPTTGKVICPRAKADRDTAAQPTCDSGGLFGWPWGINLGAGKEPDYTVDWLVFAAKPEDVICVEDAKAKAIGEVEVVYYGDALNALIMTLSGRLAWIEHNASGSAAATEYRGSAAATEYRGSAAATGNRGSAAATGDRGSAAATGYSGSAAATGYSGSAAATGDSGSAAATGDRGSAAATGYRGSAAATGDRGSAAATGDMGVACLVGEDGQIQVSRTSLGAVTASRWWWMVRGGAVVACRWKTPDGWQQRLLVADELNLKDGTVVQVHQGQIVEESS